MTPHTPDPETQREIDAMIYAEIRKRDRRNARFWLAALATGLVSAAAAWLAEGYPWLRALLALTAFAGIFGCLAFLSTRKGFRDSVPGFEDLP